MIGHKLLAWSAAAFVLAQLLPLSEANAQGRGVRLYTVKDTRIDPTRDKVVIDLRDMRGAVRALRLRTPSEPLLLTNFRIVYTDGRVVDDERRINLLAGERTRATDPSRRDRFVDYIELFIDPRTREQDSVRVQVIAHQTRQGRRLRRPLERETEEGTAVSSLERKRNRLEFTRREAIRRGAIRPGVSRREADRQEERARPSGTILDGARDPLPLAIGSGEVLFGAQRVGLGLDRDVVRVGNTIGKFHRMRLRVLENDVFMNTMTVIYRDGSEDTIPVNAEISRDTTSRWFNLRSRKFISEVRLRYRSRTNFRGRARVELFGEFTRGWLGNNGEGRRFNNGWVLLGAQTAGFVGFDDDVVPVGHNKGGFRQVRVSVRDRAITLNQLQVIYGDGTSDTVPVKTRVAAGTTWGPFDLKGNRRPIREVRARYRSRFFDRDAHGRGAAVVEIWGRY